MTLEEWFRDVAFDADDIDGGVPVIPLSCVYEVVRERDERIIAAMARDSLRAAEFYETEAEKQIVDDTFAGVCEAARAEMAK